MKKFVELKNEVKYYLIGILGKLIIDLLFLTSKIDIIGEEKVAAIINSKKYIFAFWHSRLLLISYIHKMKNVLVLVSQSKDGEIISRILLRQGQATVRGSSTRGGIRAMAGMIKDLKETGRPGCVTPDGPQGPRFKVKPGIISIAQKTGYAIVPITYSASKIKIFSSWDRFILPHPFSRCRLIYGDPFFIPRNASEEEQNKYCDMLETELIKITKEADSHFGHNIS
jgi:lysophospholipid acyltransferase (LPLAT)-like uncharacterized protein